MEQEKSFWYTLVLGACMIGCLLLVGRMLLYRPAPVFVPPHAGGVTESQREEQDGQKMQFTDQDLSAMLRERLPDHLPVQDLTITTRQNGTVRVEGMLEKASLEEMAQGGVLRSALMFLPRTFPIQLVLQARTEGAELLLTPVEAHAGGLQIPMDMLSEEICQTLNRLVNAALQEKGGDYQKITVVEGGLELTA